MQIDRRASSDHVRTIQLRVIAPQRLLHVKQKEYRNTRQRKKNRMSRCALQEDGHMRTARRRSRGCFQSQPPRFINAQVPTHHRHSHMAYMQILRLIHCRETRRGKVVSVGCVGRDTKSISKSAPASHSHPVSQ